MKNAKRFGMLLGFILSMTFSVEGLCEEKFYPNFPFNFLYSGGVECAFIRVEHPEWDAVEFMTTASGGISLMMSLLDGYQIHYMDDRDLVEIRKKFDTSSKPRDYRYAPMEYKSNISKDGLVEVRFKADTDIGEIVVHFISDGALKELNQVVNPLNHAMEVIPILYNEKAAQGDEKTRVMGDGKPVKIKSANFTLGANYGIIYRTDKRVEKLERFFPGRKGLVGARWLYEVDGRMVTFSVSKDRDAEGFYEVKRLSEFVQKAWMCPVENGRKLKRLSTYSLVHADKEFFIEFDPPLFFPVSVKGKALETRSTWRAKISNSDWDAGGEIKMISRSSGEGLVSEIDFLPLHPEFLSIRPIHYRIIGDEKEYKVVATE
jgi:hypothetical protein